MDPGQSSSEDEIFNASFKAQENNSDSERFRMDHYRVPKIPPFFRADPALWFFQTESSFRNSKITDERTKADHIIASLDFEVVACLKDIIVANPQPTDIYQRIKKRIISNYSASAESKLRQLLKGQVLSDGKPSHILSGLRNLNEGSCSDDVIKSIFMEQLSPQHRAILASVSTTDLNKLAEIADKISENFADNGSQILACSRNAIRHNESSGKVKNTAVDRSDLNGLCNKLDALISRVEILEKRFDREFRNRSRSKSTSRFNRNRSNDQKGANLCKAHKFYPDNPKSCKEWCIKYSTFKPSENC